MSSEQEQFEKLRLLLSVKRYEQPPPGYFNRLSSDIMAQIRAGQTLDQPGFEERLEFEVPWLHRLWQALETKPVFAGSLGVAICGLFLAGIAYYSAPDIAPELSGTPMAEAFSPATSPGNSPGVLSAQFAPAVPGYSGLQSGATGVLSLVPAPAQRHPYAMPVMGSR